MKFQKVKQILLSVIIITGSVAVPMNVSADAVTGMTESVQSVPVVTEISDDRTVTGDNSHITDEVRDMLNDLFEKDKDGNVIAVHTGISWQQKIYDILGSEPEDEQTDAKADDKKVKSDKELSDKPDTNEYHYKYVPDGGSLNPFNGVYYGPSGRETYYNLDMSRVVYYMKVMGIDKKYWVRDDGVKMYGDYVMCAANLDLRPKGTIVQTSLGKGIVVDTGGFAYGNGEGGRHQLDIAVAWGSSSCGKAKRSEDNKKNNLTEEEKNSNKKLKKEQKKTEKAKNNKKKDNKIKSGKDKNNEVETKDRATAKNREQESEVPGQTKTTEDNTTSTDDVTGSSTEFSDSDDIVETENTDSVTEYH